MTEFLVWLVTGAIAGTLAGLLGVGGGIVIVPALAWSFTRSGLAPEHTMHLAVGTSLMTIVVTSLASARAHHQRGAVLWDVVGKLTPGILVGALLGAMVADELPSRTLQTLFALFLLTVSLQMSLNRKPAPRRELPGRLGTGVAGAIIGLLSALTGIGGGSLTVPFLGWCNIHLRNAVATSSACGLPIAVAGAAGFLVAGLDEVNLPRWSSGYLYWPAFAGIVLTSGLFAPLGAHLAHTLPVTMLKRMFGGFLFVVGLKMLLG